MINSKKQGIITIDIKSPSLVKWQLRSAMFSVKYNVAKGEVFPLNLNDACNYREHCTRWYMQNQTDMHMFVFTFKYSKGNCKISSPRQRLKCQESQIRVGTPNSRTKQGHTGGSSVNNSGGNRQRSKEKSGLKIYG